MRHVLGRDRGELNPRPPGGTCPDDERWCRAPTLCADDLHVEMSQPAGDRQSEDHHALHRHSVPVQVVVQRAVLVVL